MRPPLSSGAPLVSIAHSGASRIRLLSERSPTRAELGVWTSQLLDKGIRSFSVDTMDLEEKLRGMLATQYASMDE